MECEVNLRKSKQAFIARSEEYEKAKTAAFRAEEEGGGATAKSVERKRRLEEEARNKVITNHLTYRRMRFHMVSSPTLHSSLLICFLTARFTNAARKIHTPFNCTKLSTAMFNFVP